MSARTSIDDFAWLHLYAQDLWHGSAYIAGTRHGIQALVTALQAALASANGVHSSHEFFVNDGESYEIDIRVLPHGEFERLGVPYTGDIARCEDKTMMPWHLPRNPIGEKP